MPPICFTASILPNTINNGDIIRIKGLVKEDAREFSINFVNEPCSNPQFISYHFKWLIDENVIVQNYKDNGEWINHQEQPYDKLDGTTFELEFAFHDDFIDSYKIYQNSPNRITSFEPYFALSDIKALQVWGDVQKVMELGFKYA